MFTANYPSLMPGVNKPGTVVTLTLPTLAASCTGQDLSLCILLLPSTRAFLGLILWGIKSQAGFVPKSPGVAELSPRSGCSWGIPSARDPRWPPLHHMGCLEQISVPQNPKKLLRGLAATDSRSLNKKQGLARAGSSLDPTPALLMFPNPAAPIAVGHS